MFKLLILFFIIVTKTIAENKKLYIYNWSDYITQDTIKNFEKNTGIKVIYDVFDSNEVLEAKLMAGNIGYDVVVSSENFLSRPIASNIFLELNKSKLPNYKNLDKKLITQLTHNESNNRYGVPYLWTTAGIGYNVEKIKKILGKEIKLDSWNIIFQIENLKKLEKCGISFLDTPEEIFSIILQYLKKNPNSKNKKDYDTSAKFLLKLRPYIRYFHSSQHINDLINGNICISISWIGDILQLKNNLSKLNDINIDYILPKEGSVASVDMLSIPKNAKNINEAYSFINYLLETKVIDNISKKIFYNNMNKKHSNEEVYLPLILTSKLFILQTQNIKLNRIRTKLWTKIKISK